MEAQVAQVRMSRTRSAMLAAGLDLLADRPIDAIAIDEVVAAAGVAKGTFFNHFEDKRVFAQEVAAEIRSALENLVTASNGAIADPLERLSAGMMVSAGFALIEPKRTAVLLRAARGLTHHDHPLNSGVRRDLRGCEESGALRPAAMRLGMLFWNGCCSAVMARIIEQRASLNEAAQLTSDMMMLALTGLGAEESLARSLSDETRIAGALTRIVERQVAG